MRSATANFVTVFDVSIVVGVCTCGVISGIIGLNNVREINQKLSEADKELALFNDQIRDRKRGIMMLAVVFISVTGMIILDLCSRYRSTVKEKTSLEHAGKGKNVSQIFRGDEFNLIFSKFSIEQRPMKCILCRTCHFICSTTL